ncbi:DNA-methyltransferase [Cellulosimicrobium funkei]|uniref:DNA-methyltransferase n=1 Tax=Cellulosimicrobium funkei TaxID=264251 RepID=UPI00342E00BC
MSTAPHYTDDQVTLYHGDCLAILRELPDNSVDSVVTDPPYGLANTSPAQVVETITAWATGDREHIPTGAGFMGKAWDAFVPPVAVWDEALRVLKPGGHLVAFAGSRTFDLMTLGVRLAGFEIRDSIAWLYGSGFPKSLDVAKAITGAQLGHGSNSGAIRRATMGEDYTPSGVRGNRDGVTRRSDTGMADRDLALTPDAEPWQGWGTALKPAFEPIVVGRKPLAGTVAANVLAHGTGALNIDGCRVESGERPVMVRTATEVAASSMSGKSTGATSNGETTTLGRWPTNVVLDGELAEDLDAQSGSSTSRVGKPRGAAAGAGWGMTATGAEYDDAGGASRFFPVFRYEAKVPTTERPRVDGVAHPTVKPLDLMRWLVRLVTPPGGVVLEPFAGSGTTAEACVVEGFRCIAIEREADYLPLITSRLTKPIEMALDLGITA